MEDEKTAEKPSKNRLNDLLTSLAKMDGKTLVNSKVELKKIGVAAKKKIQKEKERKKEDSDSDTDDDKPKNVIEAAKDIAKKIGGDVNQTEAELLSKLLGTEISTDAGKKDLK